MCPVIVRVCPVIVCVCVSGDSVCVSGDSVCVPSDSVCVCQVREVTEQEANVGTFSLTAILAPLPGYEVRERVRPAPSDPSSSAGGHVRARGPLYGAALSGEDLPQC